MNCRRRFTAADHDLIDRMLADGESFDAIGAALGRIPSNVFRYAVRVGLHAPRPWRVMTESERDGIAAMYRAGASLAAIRVRYRVATTTIYHTLRVRGVPVRSPGRAQGGRHAMTVYHARRRAQEAPAP